ncbi:N6-L-threonylcarbamoyladenine synthase [Breznakia blatticola]|uniref:tRNA N6-adenosine threonylcarbamoyltransferase n=1 Tax=Breznakia blatticola TaxID=1754012 RepID=A0A4R8A6C0_9FIRM|nr:tRNA (adenosine(37)-N6)-threonylcarbamoyltransferase complex transferase subunit TsaD [Breznakia blatticola]TDW25098.1 N6-L-threonylcarbamoyladenine synthase [Breznakia blatticola]
MKDITILAIESSCDESACAIVRNGKEILSNVVATQIEVHEKFGGVLPEVASRLHVEQISAVIDEAVEKAGISVADVDAIAYTRGPGLIGSLHVGVQAAKTLAWAYHKPLLPIHHIKSHIFANNLITNLKFPLLALVVSGGHSEIVYMKDDNSYEILGQTQDDAIGEAYDKVARVLHLGYPGGPKIDKLAKGVESLYKLPQPKTQGEFDLSFSGLKSGVLQFVDRCKRKGETYDDATLAASFQETALNEIMDKLVKAIDTVEVNQVLLAGGVAANSRLREKMDEAFKDRKEELILPPLWVCTDNAAMVAVAGYFAYKNEAFGDFSQSAKPSLKVMDIQK